MTRDERILLERALAWIPTHEPIRAEIEAALTAGDATTDASDEALGRAAYEYALAAGRRNYPTNPFKEPPWDKMEPYVRKEMIGMARAVRDVVMREMSAKLEAVERERNDLLMEARIGWDSAKVLAVVSQSPRSEQAAIAALADLVSVETWQKRRRNQ